MDALKAALERALKDAQEMPLEAQIREREGFIERACKGIAKFDLRLEESERKLEELRALHNKQAGSATSSTSHGPCRRSRPSWCHSCNGSCIKVSQFHQLCLVVVFGRGRITSQPRSTRSWSGCRIDRWR